ncbi:hypothetical protein [Sulfurimonas sp. C5]|uniref:hypothetical protein n=1 Tax=Sulfurimonas sp. C5 TaxID=3036947 RepID=UPI002454DB91|nr:hypothetical protein [Sulfurimonas sp. C5]MDH4945088.1 hypothetical protein [Sulfurimonas sp. C5]
MSKKIGLHIGGRRFDVDVEDEFATFLQSQMQRDFNCDGNNDAKTMLQAYVRQTYEIFTQNKKIDEIVKKIDKED